MKIIDIANTSVEAVISEACDVLQSGGLVLFPTETTYGAGVDATNQAAVDKLLAYKSRREGKPLSILVANEKMAKEYVEINDQAKKLYDQFLPGPVTVISKSKGNVAKGVESEFGTLGIRIPDYVLMLKISKAFGKPITATSANASGEKRPYSIDDILAGLSKKQKSLINLVLDAGVLPKNKPSTVIDTTLSAPVTLRSGNLSLSNHNAKNSIVLFSNSEAETKAIAGRLLLKNWNKIISDGFVVCLDGELGIGKTIFAKGSAEFLKIEDIIKSPTYSYIEEYDFKRHQTKGRFYHLDMWKVDDKETFKRLEISRLFKPNTLVVIEWYSQIAKFLEKDLKNVPHIKVNFSLLDGKRRMEIEE